MSSRVPLDELVDLDLSDDELYEALLALEQGDLRVLAGWEATRRDAQTPQWEESWETWLMLHARQTGKTRALIQATNEAVWDQGVRKVCVAGRTKEDTRDVLMAAFGEYDEPERRPFVGKSPMQLRWSNGAVGHVRSADVPESGRGGGYELVCCDELGSWWKRDNTGATLYDNLTFAASQGEKPRVIIATTPPGIGVQGRRVSLDLIKRIRSDPETRTTNEGMEANRANLPLGYIEARSRDNPPGTLRHTIEIKGELVEDVPGALWTDAMLTKARLRPGETARGLARQCSPVVVGVDLATTSKPTSDATGICVAGRLGELYVVFALEEHRVAPDVWAQRTVYLAEEWGATRVYVENNQGGEMVERLLRDHAGDTLWIEPFHTSASKANRADPVAALYAREERTVIHADYFEAGEAQMTSFPVASEHDDMVDSLVFAVGGLMGKGMGAWVLGEDGSIVMA